KSIKNGSITISQLSCQKLFYICWNSSIPISQWQKIDVMGLDIPISTPIYKVFEYSPEMNIFFEVTINEFLNIYENKARYKKVLPSSVKAPYTEKLKKFNESDLLDLYVQRLFFDGFIGIGKVHGKLSDIDLIVRSVNPKTFGQLYFFEIKEKNPSRGESSGFGMDIPRIEDLNYLQATLGRKVIYIVRHIDPRHYRGQYFPLNS
ncbi:hypothetical protein ABFP33_20825, partial [Acinetobacter bereziniae]|uniref:hypothetical protein n=1 Tax=Acinetobacter bereziniae TaxID=106648 RepID=UPI003212FEA6